MRVSVVRAWGRAEGHVPVADEDVEQEDAASGLVHAPSLVQHEKAEERLEDEEGDPDDKVGRREAHEVAAGQAGAGERDGCGVVCVSLGARV